ncbi:MAG: hypothetical protein WC455_11545 [Dehalococcoidia bacterium]|jgi:hypothetical protein
MSKPALPPKLELHESQIIETLLAGLKEWRPDLQYPESHSDMQACVRGLLVMYDVTRKPLPSPLPSPCPSCEGLGHYVRQESGYRHLLDCEKCGGTGKMYY